MSLDPDSEEMRRLGYLAIDRAVAHLATLEQKRVARRVSSQEMHDLVHEPLPQRGHGVEDSLARFFDRILPAATLVNHPRFFAYIPGPGSFVGAIGEWVAAATNLFVGTWLGGAAMAQLEIEVLDWLRQALGLRERWHGVITSGGSMANLGALAAARARAGAPAQGVVYASDEAHYSVTKAARILGFAEGRVRVLATGDDQRLRPDRLAAALRSDRDAGLAPVAVCATAGTTTTGAIDALGDIADVCRDHGVWLHVDGAYGGAVALLPEQRLALAGIERADSITLDPHKWLYCPFEAGGLLVRDEAALRAAFGAEGQYMQDIPRDEVNFFERGPELSRGNRALKLWLLLRAVGIDAIAAAIREDLRLCRLARDLIAEDPRLAIVTEPQLSVFTFEVRAGESAGRALIERVMADGFAMLSSSRARGRFVLRFCVVNHRTTESDVRRTAARIRGLV